MKRKTGNMRLGSVLGALAISLGLAGAVQAYPDKPITMVVPNGAGGANDAVARLFAEELGTRLGQSVVVENRSGAGGNIGTSLVARAQPDGYTLLMTVNNTLTINPLLYKNLNFDAAKDLAPIGGAGSTPYVVMINQDVESDTMEAFIAEARANPGKFRYGSTGNGSLPHLLAVMLAHEAGIDLEHVPYRGISQALTDVLGRQISMAFATPPASMPHMQAGSLRALGVTSAQRVEVLPDVPAISETVPGYQGLLWIALYAPAGMPQDVVDKLARTLDEARKEPSVRKRLAEMGVDVMDEGPQELAKRQETETRQWDAVLKRANISLD